MAVTQLQQENFIKQIGPIAVKEAKKRNLGNAQIWTCIAQACDESRYGTSTLMSGAKAYFGIKATEYWVKQAKYGGLVFSAKTKECYDGRSYSNITACFRAYRSMEDSVADYFDLLGYSRYKACLTKQTVRECITVIKNGGYATAPDYINTICNFYNRHKELIETFTVDGIITPPMNTPVNDIPAPASLDAIAKQVIAGQWGNGAVRKQKLEAAGYNYYEVQKLVNKLLKK